MPITTTMDGKPVARFPDDTNPDVIQRVMKGIAQVYKDKQKDVVTGQKIQPPSSYTPQKEMQPQNSANDPVQMMNNMIQPKSNTPSAPFRPVRNVGVAMAEGVNKGFASTASGLNTMYNYLNEKLGAGARPDFFKRAIKEYESNAQYWENIAQKGGISKALHFIGKAIGEAPTGIADFEAGAGAAATKGAARAKEQGGNEIVGAAKGAAEWALMKLTLGQTGQLTPAPRIGANAGVFGAQAAAQGGTAEQVGEAAITGAMYGIPGKGGTGIKELGRNAAKLNKEIGERGSTSKKPDVDPTITQDTMARFRTQFAEDKAETPLWLDKGFLPAVKVDGKTHLTGVGHDPMKDIPGIKESSEIETGWVNGKTGVFTDRKETEWGENEVEKERGGTKLGIGFGGGSIPPGVKKYVDYILGGDKKTKKWENSENRESFRQEGATYEWDKALSWMDGYIKLANGNINNRELRSLKNLSIGMLKDFNRNKETMDIGGEGISKEWVQKTLDTLETSTNPHEIKIAVDSIANKQHLGGGLLEYGFELNQGNKEPEVIRDILDMLKTGEEPKSSGQRIRDYFVPAIKLKDGTITKGFPGETPDDIIKSHGVGQWLEETGKKGYVTPQGKFITEDKAKEWKEKTGDSINVIVPAVRQGKTVMAGKIGDTHPDVMKAHDIGPDAEHERGFMGPDGKFMTRARAKQWMKKNRPELYEEWVATVEEGGEGKSKELHSQDMNKAQKKVGGLNRYLANTTVDSLKSTTGASGEGASLEKIGGGKENPGTAPKEWSGDVLDIEDGLIRKGVTDAGFAEVLSQGKGIEVTPEGLKIKVTRFQNPGSTGSPSMTSGVYYSPSARSGSYKGTGEYGMGGSSKVSGSITVNNPLVVRNAGADGLGYTTLEGILGVKESRALRQKTEKELGETPSADSIRKFLNDNGGDSRAAEQIFNWLQRPDVSYTALGHINRIISENISFHQARKMGYDSILGYSTIDSKYNQLDNVVALRIDTYPSTKKGTTLGMGLGAVPDQILQGLDRWLSPTKEKLSTQAEPKGGKEVNKKGLDQYLDHSNTDSLKSSKETQEGGASFVSFMDAYIKLSEGDHNPRNIRMLKSNVKTIANGFNSYVRNRLENEVEEGLTPTERREWEKTSNKILGKVNTLQDVIESSTSPTKIALAADKLVHTVHINNDILGQVFNHLFNPSINWTKILDKLAKKNTKIKVEGKEDGKGYTVIVHSDTGISHAFFPSKEEADSYVSRVSKRENEEANAKYSKGASDKNITLGMGLGGAQDIILKGLDRWLSPTKEKLSAQGEGKAPAEEWIKRINAWGAKNPHIKDENMWNGLTAWIESKKGEKGGVKKDDIMEMLELGKGEWAVREQTHGTTLPEEQKNRIKELDRIAKTERALTPGEKQEQRNLKDGFVHYRKDPWSDYNVPGGIPETAKVWTLSLPKDKVEPDYQEIEELNAKRDAIVLQRHKLEQEGQILASNKLAREHDMLINRIQELKTGPVKYVSPHFWDKPNVVIHFRTQETKDSTGEKGLLIETIQSDWHQERGGQDEDVPAAPFEKSWAEVGLKHALDIAAQDPSVKWVGWSSGEVQNERWGKGEDENDPHFDRKFEEAQDKLTQQYLDKHGVTELPESEWDRVDEEAMKIAEKKTKETFLSILYDKRLPKFAKKYAKKLGGKYRDDILFPYNDNRSSKQEEMDKITKEFENGEIGRREMEDLLDELMDSENPYSDSTSFPIHRIDLTDSLRTHINTKGQEFYQMGGPAVGGLIKAVAGDDEKKKKGKDQDYDMEGYITKYGKPDQSKGQHLTDEFKLPHHITFSVDSKYSNEKTKGGVWKKDEKGKWHYRPSKFVLTQHPMKELQWYFKKHEPDSVLDMPKGEE